MNTAIVTIFLSIRSLQIQNLAYTLGKVTCFGIFLRQYTTTLFVLIFARHNFRDFCKLKKNREIEASRNLIPSLQIYIIKRMKQ